MTARSGAEQPYYFQGVLPHRPGPRPGAKDAELAGAQPFAAVADDGDRAAGRSSTSTHSPPSSPPPIRGMTVDAFETIAKDWIATAKHPR